MRTPSNDLVFAVKSKKLNSRIRRQVLRYRGYFRAYDQEGSLVHDQPEEIVRVELTPRLR